MSSDKERILDALESGGAEVKKEAETSEVDKITDVLTNVLGQGLPSVVIQDSGLWELWTIATKIGNSRRDRYSDYDIMEKDSLVASALELVTEDAVQYSIERKASIWGAEGSDKDFVKRVFDKIGLEERISGWVYNLAKYGDFFLRVNTRQEAGKLVFMGVDDSIHPIQIYRIDTDDGIGGFLWKQGAATGDPFSFYDVKPLKPWEVIHFMVNFKGVFEKHKIKLREKDAAGRDVIEVTSRYGTSILDAVRRQYKILNMMEQAVALGRLYRAPLIRVYYVNTEGLTDMQRRRLMYDIEQRFKQKIAFDTSKKLYKSSYNPLSFNADIFLPITGTVGDIRVESIGGDMNIKDLADLTFHKNKFFSGLRIPQAYLGFEGAMPGTIGSTTLVRMDIRYARMIKRLQRAVLNGLTRLLTVVWAIERQEVPTPEKVALEMLYVSGAEEADRLEAIEKKFNIASSIINSLAELKERYNVEPIYEYVFQQVLGAPDLFEKIRKGKKPPQQGGGRRNLFQDRNTMKDLIKEMMNNYGILKAERQGFVPSPLQDYNDIYSDVVEEDDVLMEVVDEDEE